MIQANLSHRQQMIDILATAFAENKSVNYLLKDDRRKHARVRALMAYSFDVCYTFGELWLSADRQACALLLLPERRKTSLKTLIWDLQLVMRSIGLAGVQRAQQRESRIKKHHPETAYAYLWFVATAPGQQGQGVGTSLMKEILARYDSYQLPLYLETSTLRNLPWYKKLGFEVYKELDFSFPLFMLRREPGL